MSSSFEGFCILLGLQDVGPYLQMKEARNIEDWTSTPLDPQGRRVQEEMTKKFQVNTHFQGYWPDANSRPRDYR
jgi:exportin-5